MDEKPCRHSLDVVNPNENENARDEDCCEEITNEGSCVERQIAAQPPKQKGNSWNNQTE